jgi:hypothetical protein
VTDRPGRITEEYYRRWMKPHPNQRCIAVGPSVQAVHASTAKSNAPIAPVAVREKKELSNIVSTPTTVDC